MDRSLKSIFVIGLVAAVAAGLFGWSQGWLSLPESREASKSAALPPAPLKPAVPPAEQPKSDAVPPAGDRSAAPVPETGRSAVQKPNAEAPGSPMPGAEAGSAETRTPPPPSGAGETPSAPSGAVAALPPVAARPPEASAEKGAFDIVRVEPSGEMVVAGRCPSGCTAELTANGRTQDKAAADASGAFAMTPPALPPGDHQLGLTVTTPDGERKTSEQTVTVSVPKAPSKDVVVVLNDPDAPSKILQQPGQEPAAAAKAEGPVAALEHGGAGEPTAKTPAQSVASLSLAAVDAERGRFFVQGTAPAGARLRVYLNNVAIAEAVAGADERWSLRVERGLTAGRYVVRVDQVDAAGKVATRVEQSFDYEAEPQVAAADPKAPTPAAPQPATGMASARGEPSSAGTGQPSGATSTRPEGQTSNQTRPSPLGTTTSGQAAQAPATGSATQAPAPESPSGAGQTAAVIPPSAVTPPSTTDEPSRAAGQSAAPTPNGQQSAAPSVSRSDPANPVVASIDTAKVKRGDSLWRISRQIYGRGKRYTMIFTANDKQIRNPNLIYPGQVLVLPQNPGG